MSEKRMRFLNTHVDNLTMAEAVEEAKKLVQKGGKSYVVTKALVADGEHIALLLHEVLDCMALEIFDPLLTGPLAGPFFLLLAG